MPEAVKLLYKGKKETSSCILFLFLSSTISAFDLAQAYSEDNSVVNCRVPQGNTSYCLVIASGMLRWTRHMSFKGRTETAHDVM